MQAFFERAPWTASACLFLGFFGSTFAQGNVIVVDQAGGPSANFLEIQPAVDAALDGDVILVKPGVYDTFTIQAKSLQVIGDFGFEAKGGVQVRDLGPTQSVVIRQLSTTALPDGAGLALIDNEGPVWIESSALVGQSIPFGDADGFPGARVDDSDRVSFLRCIMRGGIGGPNGSSTLPIGGNGGPALLVDEGTAFVQACALNGGRGSDTIGGLTLSNGGAGTHNRGGQLILANSQVQGGPGGLSGLVFGGSGGAGVRNDAGTSTVIATVPLGGPPGSGAPGQSFFVSSGTIELHGGFQNFGTLNVASPVREGQLLPFQYQAPPNAQLVFAAISTTQDPVYLSNLLTTVYLGAPVTIVPLGSTDFEGFFMTSFTAPQTPPGVDSLTFYVQAFSTLNLGGGVGTIAVSGGTAITVLDSAF